MRRPWSLRGRVTLAAVATLAVWVALATLAANLVLDNRLSAQADDVLQARAEAAASTVDVGPRGQVSVHDPDDDASIDVGTWIFRGSQLLEHPRVGTSLTSAATSMVGRGTTYDEVRQPKTIRLYAYPVTDRGRTVATVVTSLAMGPYEQARKGVLLGSTALALLFLLGAFLVLRAGVSRALSPVTSMTDQAEEWSAGAPGQRFGDAPRPVELAALARTLDALLDRLAAVLRHEQQLAGELSHELRTPLSRIIAETALLQERVQSADELAAGHASIAQSAEEMRDILETLLATARSESGAPAGSCDAEEVANQVAGRYAGSAGSLDGRCVRVVRHPGSSRAGLDAALLERALVPVVDNAVRYCSREVRLEVSGDQAAVLVDVVDDGPGIPPAELPLVFEPGRRLDPGDGHDGAGLGLALARRLLRAAGGDVIASSTTDGATFRLRLPRG